MRFLFLFLDGVGLGPNDPARNPLTRAEMPNLRRLLAGHRLVADSISLAPESAPPSPQSWGELPTETAVPPRIGGSGGPVGPTETAVPPRIGGSGGPLETARATLLPLDACLGVKGDPQSATGQATLLTGRNVAAALGRHFGPKPDPTIAGFLREDNILSPLTTATWRI